MDWVTVISAVIGATITTVLERVYIHLKGAVSRQRFIDLTEDYNILLEKYKNLLEKSVKELTDNE